MATNVNNPSSESSNNLDLRRFFRSVKRLRWVYIGSFILFMGLALTYCLVKQPQYEVKATLLIEDPSGDAGLSAAGGMATMMRTFSVGGFGGSSVNNELQLISSHDVLMSTSRLLGLNRNYIARDGMGKEMLFLDSPIAVEAAPEMMDTLTKAMKIRVDINGDKADISVTRGLLGREIASKEGATLPATVETPFGPIQVLKTAHYTGAPQRIDVSLGSYDAAADYLFTEIEVDTPDKLADAVSFSFLYPNRERGRAILNTIMAEYNAKRLKRKHATAKTQVEFLNDRIAKLLGEIAASDSTVEAFREKNKIASLSGEATAMIENSFAMRAEMTKATAENTYYTEILNSLRSPEKADQLLPVFDSQAYEMIKDYNELVMAKKDLERSAKASNPALESAEDNLRAMRTSVIRNVESLQQAAQATLKAQRALVNEADAKLGTLPKVEREYTEILRDRTLQNELYAYLSSQRESALLQLYNDETLGFVVDEAYTAIKPSKKKALIACAGCFFLAFFFPTCLALWLTWRHRRVTDAMDVASAGIESSTVVLDGSKASVNSLRTMIMERSGSATVYVSGDASTAVIADLVESFGAIGRKTDSVTPAQLNLPYDNDSLLTPEFAAHIARVKSMAPAPAAVMVNVPDPDRVKELASMMSDAHESIVLLAYAKGGVAIKTVNDIVATFPEGSVMLALK